MSKKFRGIRPSDMSKLERIVELTSRHADRFAAGTADTIVDPLAREVANILIGRSVNGSQDFSDFIDYLRHRVKAANGRIIESSVA